MILRTLLLILLAASCAVAQPVPDTLRAPVEADSITVFGWTVDADADRLLVGARVWPPPYPRAGERGATVASLGDHHGTVFVYRQRADGSWAVEGRLKADYISNEDCFGWSMDLRGDLAAVGARCEYGWTESVDGGSFPYNGAVYVFRYDGTDWVRVAKLVSPQTGEETPSVAGFGLDVALGDGYLITGVRGALNPSNPEEDYGSGAAFVFEPSGETWAHVATLINADADDQINERFGTSVVAAGSDVLIGAPRVNGPDLDRSGAVYVFSRGGDGWTQTKTLTAPVPTSQSYFGQRLAGNEGGAATSSWASSSVYLVELANGAWRVEGTLPLPADVEPYGLDRRGDFVLVTDSQFGVEGGKDAYLFERKGDNWSATRFPTGPYEAAETEMVSLTNTHAYIGSPEAFGGEVLVYDLGTATSSEPSSPDEAVLALTVAPNPLSSRATAHFELSKPGDVRVMVYDVLGREVMRAVEGARAAGAQSVELDTSGLAPGVYVLRLQTESEAVTQRFTVVR